MTETVEPRRLQPRISITPNRAASPSQFSVTITRGGQPVTGATVIAHFAMLDIEDGTAGIHAHRESARHLQQVGAALVMAGHWGLSFDVEPTGAAAFTVILVDKAEG